MVKPDTKSRIIATALDIFNDHRFGAVTTAALAEELEMTEGNLWYHFNSKRDLLKAITEIFIPRVEKRLVMRPSSDGRVLHEYAKMLVVFTQELQDFRFLYRDQADYGEHTKVLRKKLPKFFDDTFVQFNDFHQALIDQGLLVNDKERIEAYTEASILAFRFHLEFTRERGVTPADDGSAIGAAGGATALHLKLFAPLFAPATFDELREKIQEFQQCKPA